MGVLMNRCLKCNNDFEGNLCPFCGTKYSMRETKEISFSNTKFKISPVVLYIFLFAFAVSLSFIPSQHVKNVIGGFLFGLIGLLMILIPNYFVKVFIWIVQKNYEQSLDEEGKPLGGKGPFLFKAFEINKRNLSKPPNSTQEWLIRFLGLMVLILALQIFNQEFRKIEFS